MVGAYRSMNRSPSLLQQDRALAARRLGQQDAQLVEARRVELEQLHVLQGDAAAEARPPARRR